MTRYQIAVDFGAALAITHGLSFVYYCLWKGSVEDRTEAALTAVLMSLISAVAIGDILMTYGVHEGPRGMQYAVAIWMLGQAYIIAVRFARARSAAERASSELKKVDRLKDEFLANTSHELRTPLHGIIGITESILQGATGGISDATHDNLRLVSASGRRLSNLVNDILDFSKLQHGDNCYQT